MVRKLMMTAVVFVSSSMAIQAHAQTGFQGPEASASVTTVAQAASSYDDTRVILKGYIIERLNGDDYTFKDETGSIRVDIDHDKWGGQAVKPETLVEIMGEVDKDWNSVEIDVKSIRIVQ